MNERDKYKSAHEVFNRITAELTDLPTEKFNSTLENLESWWSKLRQGDTAMALSKGDVAMPVSGTMDESAETELPLTQAAETEENNDEVHTPPGEASPTSAKKLRRVSKRSQNVFVKANHGKTELFL
ncbi:unnamed protein product [Phytophthora fragariaefolia]|uniref:Unnamed protein product n=1 Tax=Phytophthora fragariaefolia TaxID=1490495 RepID=A0A9W7CV20_9STRA|nr:unnamed protein product [Phytophthora fragariaefolia]